MLIIGCDYHPSMQQIAYVDTETGESGEQRLMHHTGEAERFYRELQQRPIKVRVGMEATGYARWFERLLVELGFELWIGDPARVRARRVRKQKTDRRDAQLLPRTQLRAYDGVVNVGGEPQLQRFQAFPSPRQSGGSKGCLRRLHFMRPFAPCFASEGDGQPVYLLRLLGMLLLTIRVFALTPTGLGTYCIYNGFTMLCAK
jgi:transposase